ncbi:hypothetical protein BS47DRAFT_1387388 [Hydnum rufescens UP504]|uniref:Choline monooxygenase, chloroplastic n=1 Tax=Hydnum rufescens UP504 TaxID=1448309 RepID=A0A9P6E0B0_9AGAM|nr:hypothetical protein BS47DRAFT_1387388 [Hydnum rufescens UP504]
MNTRIADQTRVGPHIWKTLIDGYQECYHCQIAHPGFAKSLALETYTVAPKTNYARHSVNSRFGPAAVRPGRAPEAETPPSFTFIFPTCGITITDSMWVVPISAVETRMKYDVFKRKTISAEDLRDYITFYEQVEDEDFMLCCATQRNLNTGIYSRGILHPEKEVGLVVAPPSHISNSPSRGFFSFFAFDILERSAR